MGEFAILHEQPFILHNFSGAPPARKVLFLSGFLLQCTTHNTHGHSNVLIEHLILKL